MDTEVKSKLSTKAKLGIGIAVAVAFGTIVYFAWPNADGGGFWSWLS